MDDELCLDEDEDLCLGFPSELSQYDNPNWEPLVDAVGERLAGGFMWMHENRLGHGEALHAYKRRFTRRYLYLTEDVRAYELAPCRRFVRMRLDFAIEAALCSWWTLAGWEQEDVDALREALTRAQDRVFGRS